MQVLEFEKCNGQHLLAITVLVQELADLKCQFPELRQQIVKWHEGRGSRGIGVMISVVGPGSLDRDIQQLFHEAHQSEPTLAPILANKSTYLSLLDMGTGDPRIEVKLPLVEAPRTATAPKVAAPAHPTEEDRRVRQLFLERMAGVEPMVEPPGIPADKLASAERHFLFLKPDEELLGLVDETLSGTCKDGYAFTTRRIYWRPAFFEPQSVTYEELRGPFRVKGLINKRLELGGGLSVDASGSPEVAQHAVSFLGELLRSPSGSMFA